MDWMHWMDRMDWIYLYLYRIDNNNNDENDKILASEHDATNDLNDGDDA